MTAPLAHRAPRATREDVENLERELLTPVAVFSAEAWERPQPEAPDPYRTCFTRDRDRVLHCGAFRRLKDKTQVFVIDEGDFYRTRLTHTLEVSQLSRFLCQALRLNEALGEVLALVHDIGHPPFGHEGERILDACTDKVFDHNQQALRIIDVLESPYADRRGLNLTHMVRRMVLKHGGASGRGAPPTTGHVLEAQVADLADSTAYQHHDVEDGLRAGILVPGELDETSIWREAAEAVGGLPEGPQGTKRVLNQILKTSLYDIIDSSLHRLDTCGASTAEEIAASPELLVGYSERRAEQHVELGHFLYECYYRYLARSDSGGLERSVCDYVAGMTDRFAVDEWRRLAASRSVVSLTSAVLGNDLGARVTALEDTVGYVFRDKNLAATALTHSSARTSLRPPNERLEFLGDSVLGVVVGQELYLRFPDRSEGELSRMKSATVSRHALQTVSNNWDLAELLVLGPGFRNPQEAPPSVAADGVEAVLGAIFLDGHLEAVRRVILAEFLPILEAAAEGRRGRNAKSELQTFTQAEVSATPHYLVLAEEGPDHRKQFTVAAMIHDVKLAVATGRNKRQAEQRAAREALHMLHAAQSGQVPPPEGLSLPLGAPPADGAKPPGASSPPADSKHPEDRDEPLPGAEES
jgi:dGTPase